MFRKTLRCFAIAIALCSPLAAAPLTAGGGDDTQALSEAFSSCIPGGPGCTVQLGAGTFHTTQILLSGFNGSVSGAGMGATVIEPFGQLHVDKDAGNVYSQPPSALHPYPHLIMLLGSDITVSDLTFNVPLAEPTDGWYYGCDDCYVTWLKTMISVDGSGRFFRVEFIGKPGTAAGTATGANVNNGPDINGSGYGAGVGGEFVVQNSRFVSLDNGFEVGPVDGLHATIGGSPRTGNVFQQSSAGIFFKTTHTTIDESYNDIEGAGLVSLYNDANRISFAHNRVRATLGPALDVENYRGFPRTGISTVAAEHNDIAVSAPGVVAMYLDDRWLLSNYKSIDALIAANSVTLSDPSGDQGIAGIWLRYLSDALVEANRVSGTGCAAFYLGRISFSVIKANNVENFVANDPTCEIPPAIPYFFYVLAHDNLLVGGGRTLANSVIDWGTNDTLAGVNSMTGTPPGPAVSEANQDARDIR